jgi:hypothetical protein
LEQTLDDDALNTSVFEPMCSGFADSSPALRELTLKATLVLVPHLTHPNLEKLSRYLVRLQGDEESSIRTNTVIFFSKLAPYLTETTRQKMLLPAFIRAMKDPFTPCRNAALKSTLKAKEFFDPEGIAARVLPAVTPQLLDPSPEVRREAFAAVDELLFVLRQESERMNSIPQMVPVGIPPSQPIGGGGSGNGVVVGGAAMPVSSTHSSTTIQQPQNPVATTSTGNTGTGYGFGISSWMGKSQSSTPTPPSNTVVPAPTPPQQQHQYQQQTIPAVVQPSRITANTVEDNWSDHDDIGDDEGWDEDDLLDLNTTKVTLPPLGISTSSNGSMKPPQLNVPAAAPLSNNSSLFGPSPSSMNTNNDDDEFFDAFDVKPTTVMKPATAMTGGGSMKLNTGGPGKLIVPKKIAGGGTSTTKLKPVITKISPSSKDDVADGWDDF